MTTMQFPHLALLFFMPHCLVHPCSPALFSPDNPRLSTCSLTPISIFHCHTLHHSSPALFATYPFLPLLSEALETRHWLLYTMDPVFTLLFTCLQTALTAFSEAALDAGETKALTFTEAPLFFYTLCIPEHLCVGFATIEWKLAG